MDYADNYFYAHNTHMVDVLTNMFRDAFNTSAFGNADNLTVMVYGVDLDTVRAFVDDLGLNHMVHDVDYDTDYDYFDNPVDDTDCVVVYCSHALYDLD